jgi:serine/threonine protein kinase
MMGERKPDLKPGDRIGRYEILGMLGEGGFGTAYLAEQELIKRKAVIKIITVPDQEMMALALQGTEVLASVDHPHIVDLYDAGWYEGLFYQVLEYVDGDNLADMIASEKELPVTVVLRLMIDIAEALDHIHSLGIIHGDVKPENIMVSSGGAPILVDLGLAGAVELAVLRDSVFGTPAYISPEGWNCIWDTRSDLWAFGMVLHYLLTRSIPFETADEAGIVEIISRPEPLDLSALRESVPEPVFRIVERCLQKDLDKRYQSAARVRRGLESALAYLESGQDGVPPAPTVPLREASTILLNVEYTESGIPGKYREYEIKEEIGRGIFSVVYGATDLIGKREVALKILRQEWSSHEKGLVRFQREAGLLSRLDHPNVVRVYNFGRYGADFFIVMEMLKGVTLESVLERGVPFDVKQAVVVVAQVLLGLEQLHLEETVHRDVKPGNVMLQPERAVVMDLGLAHIGGETRLTMSGEICGTPRYLSPEQARGERVTFSSDLYAAGVLLYELLTGEIPHDAESAARLIFSIALDEPEPVTTHRSDLPPSLVSFLDRMLAREPAERFGSTRSAYEELLASAGLRSGDVAEIHRGMLTQFQEILAASAAQEGLM